MDAFEIRWSLDSSLYSKCRRRPTLGTRWHMDVQRTTLLAVITGDPWFPVKRRHTAFSQVLTKKGRDVLRMILPAATSGVPSFAHPPPLHTVYTHARPSRRARANPNSHVAKALCGVLFFWVAAVEFVFSIKQTILSHTREGTS